MSEKITLELPSELAERARAIAAMAHQPLEELLVQWVGMVAADPPVDSLPDGQVLRLCTEEMESDAQTRLSDLLAKNREGVLSASDKVELEQHMFRYRRGLIRRASAWKTAVSRGLKTSPN